VKDNNSEKIESAYSQKINYIDTQVRVRL